MILDDEKQRQLLIQLVNSSTIPGHAAETVASLKAAIQTASIHEG